MEIMTLSLKGLRLEANYVMPNTLSGTWHRYNRGLNGVPAGNKWGIQGKFNKGTIYTVGGVKETGTAQWTGVT